MSKLVDAPLYRATIADVTTISQHRYPDLDAHDPALEIYATWLVGAIERGRYLGWLIKRDGAVIAGAGLVLVEWWPTQSDPQPWRARIVNVWTHPQQRRQGLARQLVQQALAEADARSIKVVSLSASEMGHPLYTSLGFEPYTAEMLRR